MRAGPTQWGQEEGGGGGEGAEQKGEGQEGGGGPVGRLYNQSSSVQSGP